MKVHDICAWYMIYECDIFIHTFWPREKMEMKKVAPSNYYLFN